MGRFLLCSAALCLLTAGCSEPNGDIAERRSPSRQPASTRTEVAYDTERDARFADFVAEMAGKMIEKVSVAIDRKAIMRVQISEATTPEDTLPLTKSLMSGARREFPRKDFTIAVYDPNGQGILNAHYRRDEGVRYEIAGDDRRRDRDRMKMSPRGEIEDTRYETADRDRSGTTDKDRRFAEWAMETGRKYIRYLEADLERNGRLWLGITREVQPNDVAELTKSVLQGARTEFPRRELTATVLDPEGERIGTATLDRNGKVQWTR